MATVGKIERVPLREVWRHEAHDLTVWLEENVDVLNDVLGLSLVSAEREQNAGAFSVDLVAEDDEGRTVVIENQLERSNHDHLGKLITYTAMTDAQVAIWIVSEPRPEHVRAISWLNDSAPADFYLVKIEGIRIGDSAPAPLLTLIVQPSEEGRKAAEVKREISETGGVRRRFWTQHLERAKERTRLHAAVSPGTHYWAETGGGRSGLKLSYVIRENEWQVELYIDRGRDSDEQNLRWFDELQAQQEEIERDFAGALDWQRLDGKRACRIRHRVEGAGLNDEERWPEIQEAMVDAMIRLERTLRPKIEALSP